MLSRLKVAAYVLPGVGAVVAAAITDGCTPSPSVLEPTRAPAAPTQVVPTPTVVQPTIVAPANFDGVYGPGVFARGADSCTPPFFGNSFNGTLIISNGGTRCSIGESQTRISNGTLSGNTANYTGTGVVGTNPATWTVVVTFGANTATVNETLRLTERNNCGTTYTSPALPRTGNAP